MAKTSLQKQKNTSSENNNKNNNGNTKVKRTRKTVPRDSAPQRSSIYRGVTRHRWTGRYEAHLWDKNCWNESQNKKGRQVYLGAYDDEEAAARTYDLAALKYWGPETTLNFPLSNYEEELKEMEGESREEYIGSLRRKSSGFSRGISKYRGVARHHHNGRWEARIGRVFGNKYLYLGTYATQEEAATAYDMAAIEHRGLNAVTNFDLSRYIKWLKPNPSNTTNCPNTNSQQNPNNPKGDIDRNIIDGSVYANPSPKLGLSMQSHQQSSSSSETSNAMPPPCSGGGGSGGGTASSALGLLLQSSKFKEMLERTSAEDCPSTPSESETLPRRSFPDDIQTYFDCHDSSNYTEGDDMIFGELNSFTSPVFQFELDV